MTYAIVQVNHVSSATAVTLATPGAVTAGNLLILGVNVGDGAAITSVTDSSLNAWTQIGTDVHDAGNGQLYSLWNAQNVAGSAGAVTVTLHSGGAISAESLLLAEVSGVATTSAVRAQDTTKAVASTSTTANANTSNAITATAGDFYLAYIAVSDAVLTYTAGTGFTQITSEGGISGQTGGGGIEWKNAAGGSESSTYTVNIAGQPYSMLVAAFKPLPIAPTSQLGQYATHLGGRGAGW